MPSSADSRRRLTLTAEGLVALLVYAAAATYLTWPLAANLCDHIVRTVTTCDTLLVIWILRWGVHAFGTDPLHLFDANVLHPTRGVLARSEHLLGQLPLFAPVWAASDNPVLAFNVAVLASFALSGLFMYVLLRQWTGSKAAAYVAGFAFAFAPARFRALASPHLLQFQYLPLILLGLDRAATGSFSAACLTALALAIQVLCSYYLGYAAYALITVFVVLTIAMGRLHHPRAATALGLAVFLPLIAIVPVSVPYWRLRASQELLPPTPIVEALFRQALTAMSGTQPGDETSAGWMSLAIAGSSPSRGLVTTFASWETAGLALVALAMLGFRRAVNDQYAFRVLCLTATTVVGWLLIIGPGLRIGSSPSLHAMLAAAVPGFGNLRTTVRFGVLVSFGLSGLAGLGIHGLTCRLRRAWLRALLAVLATVGVLAQPARRPPIALLEVPVGDAVPPVYRWLAAHGGGQPVLELPTSGPPTDPALAPALAMYFSTYHWLPLVNGYTGYIPPFAAFLESYASQLPSDEALQLLVDCTNVRWIVARGQTAARRQAWRKLAGVRVVPGFDREGLKAYWLLEVLARPRRSCGDALFQTERTIEGHPVAPLRSLRAVVAASGVPKVASRRSESLARVHLANLGRETWPSTAVGAGNRVEILIRWVPEGDAGQEHLETVLVPRDLGPGEALQFPVWLAHPAEPGRYSLRVALRQARGPRQPVARRVVWRERVEVR